MKILHLSWFFSISNKAPQGGAGRLNPSGRRPRGRLEAPPTQTQRIGAAGGRQVSSVCLVCGSRRATNPAVRSRNDTSRIGTAQFVSTILPKTMFPVMAATRPTPVKKPRAEELEEKHGKMAAYQFIVNRSGSISYTFSVPSEPTGAELGKAPSPTRPPSSK